MVFYSSIFCLSEVCCGVKVPFMIYHYIRASITYAIWVLVGLPFFLCCFVLVLFPATVRYDNRLFFWMSSRLSWMLIWATGVKLNVIHKNRVPKYPKQPSIFVMNHASALDIPLVEMLVGSYPHIWMSKAEYGKIPFFGVILRRMHVIANRLSPQQGARALSKIKNLAQNKLRHILLFPEGARFSDGRIHPFFGGFAALAKKLGRPIVPVYIKNAHKVLAKDAFLINNTVSLRLTVGPSFTYGAQESDQTFKQRVHEWFCMQAQQK